MTAVAQNAWHEVLGRLRFVARALAVVTIAAWIAWFTPFDDLLDRSGTPLGGDYVMYYVAGQTVATGRSQDLYDDQQNQRRTQQIFPQLDTAQSWPYRYPPTVAVAMTFLSQLPYAWSYAVFFVMQLAILTLVAICWRHRFAFVRRQPGWLWGCLASPLVVETILGGQASLLALASISLAAAAFSRQRDALAGAALALSLYKPNVLYLIIVACFIARPRMLLGFVPTAAVGLAIAIYGCGWTTLAQYVQLALTLGSSTWALETPAWKVHGLVPALQYALPEWGRLAGCGIGLSAATIIGLLWRCCRWNDDLALGLLLTCNALFNPYVPVYDLVLLSYALLSFAQFASKSDCQISPSSGQWVIAGLFFGPHLSQILAPHIGFQLFPWFLLTGLAWVLTQLRTVASQKFSDRNDSGKAKVHPAEWFSRFQAS